MSLTKTTASKTALDPRIAELQQKIQDENYVNDAIERIAVVLSRQVMENKKFAVRSARFQSQS